MSLPGLLVALVLSLIAVAIVARPLLRPMRREPASQRHQRDRVEIYYERVLTNIRDLDEDFSTGKINEDDYRLERDVWAERGIRLLQLRDQLEREADSAAVSADAERIDRAIEGAVAAYREQLRRDPGESANGEQR